MKIRALCPQAVVEVIQKQALGIRHERNGTLRPRQRVRIFNQEEGRTTGLPFFEGDEVEAGEIIITLETTRRQRITIPFNALQRDTEGEFVHTLDEAQRARRTPIKRGSGRNCSLNR